MRKPTARKRINIRAGNSVLSVADPDIMLIGGINILRDRYGVSVKELLLYGIDRVIMDNNLKDDCLKQLQANLASIIVKRYKAFGYLYSNSVKSVMDMLSKPMSIKTVHRQIQLMVQEIQPLDKNHKKEWNFLKKLKQKDLKEYREKIHFCMKKVGLKYILMIDFDRLNSLYNSYSFFEAKPIDVKVSKKRDPNLIKTYKKLSKY